MEIFDQGFSFKTLHDEDGSVAHVEGHYARFQKQATIRKNQDFELEFYGKGASIVLGVTAVPRRAVPEVIAAARRAGQRMPAGTSAGLPGAPLANAASLPSSAAEPSSPTSPSVMARAVLPDFHSPFDDTLCDWCLDMPPFPPFDPPGGGGGGGTYHSAVRIRLFVFGTDEPVATWELPEGIGDTERKVKFEPLGFPSPDAPVTRTTWWRMVVTPLGPDPVEIYIAAHVKIADVPIIATPLTVRLTDHLFRVGLEALVPHAIVDWDKLTLSINPELADLLGRTPTILEKDISPGHSHARLRSLDIRTISGHELNLCATQHYRERASQLPDPPGFENAPLDAKVYYFFSTQLLRLAEVQDDDVVIDIQAGFTDAKLSVWGFDVGSLNGELGELLLAFDHRLNVMRPFAFFDVNLTRIGSIALPIVQLFKDIPSDVNGYIEEHLLDPDTQQQILKYMKGFLARAVGKSSTVYDFKLQDKAWQIRHSDDPVIPLPGGPKQPLVVGGPLDGGVIGLLARHNKKLDLAPAPAPVPALASAARELPRGFLNEGVQLDRLDRHKSIVVVMMENRSYDHMLGDLVNARPRTINAYDGAPKDATNLGVAGFPGGVPLVYTRDLRIGTAIPVSPRHAFNPVQFQIGDGTEQGRSSGDMQGFARDLYHRSDSPQLALTVYGEEELGVHYSLADDFLTCDRWFAAHPGPTFPNRFATVMGAIPDLDNFENDDPRIGYLKGRTIFDALSEAGIEWRVFERDLSLIRMFDRYRLDDHNVVPFDDKDDGFEALLKKGGPLPRVMFVEPNFADIPPLKTAEDDHPPADLAHGQQFLSYVCDLLWVNCKFNDVLLLITYDEHGGFYDHVPPPGTPKGEPGSYPPLIEGGPTWLGVRVPTFVISPYVSRGAISRTIFDHTSILKTILVHNRKQLPNSVLLSFGERVNQANDLSCVLDRLDPRQPPVPFGQRPKGGKRSGTIFGNTVDLQGIFEATQASTSASIPGGPPRNVIFTERINPPESTDEADFSAALAQMFNPRRPSKLF